MHNVPVGNICMFLTYYGFFINYREMYGICNGFGNFTWWVYNDCMITSFINLVVVYTYIINIEMMQSLPVHYYVVQLVQLRNWRNYHMFVHYYYCNNNDDSVSYSLIFVIMGYILLILDNIAYSKVISKLMLNDANKDTVFVELLAATGIR